MMDASDEAVAGVCGSVWSQKYHEKSAITEGSSLRGSITSNTLFNQVVVNWEPESDMHALSLQFKGLRGEQLM
jgi:hypothetical protein